MIPRQPLLILGFCLASILGSVPAAAQIDRAYFAGFSFISDHLDSAILYKNSYEVLEETDANGHYKIQRALTERVRAHAPRHFDLQMGLAETPGEVTLAFALDWENVSVSKIGDIYKIVIDLHAQILAFDFSEKKIIAAYPVAVQLRDASKVAPTDEYIKNRVRELYLTNDHGLNILDEFAKRLQTLQINAKYKNYLQLVDVSMTDRAMSKLAGFTDMKPRVFKGLIGQHFTKFLSTNQNVGILPFTKGQAIGGAMTTRFADGSIINLTIPEPDYEMRIEYTGFGNKLLDKTDVWEAWLYVTGFHLKVLEPLSGRTYLDADFRDSVTSKLIVGEEKDHWTLYQEAFFSLATNLTQQISERSSDWLSNRSKTADVSAQLEKFEEIVERCK